MPSTKILLGFRHAGQHDGRMMELGLSPDMVAMWCTFGVILVATFFYATEWASIELVSLGALAGLLLIATALPGSGIAIDALLSGFANPALITILALLVIGQGLIQTEALSGLTEWLSNLWTKSPTRVVLLALLIAGLASAVVNNTPVVVVFMPMLASIIARRHLPPSMFMMSLGEGGPAIGQAWYQLRLLCVHELEIRRGGTDADP